MATVNGRGMMGDLFIAFACIGCPQLVEAFEAVLMEDVPWRTDDSSLEIEVAFREKGTREKGTDLFSPVICRQ